MVIERNALDLPQRKPGEFHDGDPACKRLTDTFHQLQFLRARQYKFPPLVRIIDNLFDLFENAVFFLYFIYKKGSGIVHEKQFRFFPGLKPCQPVVKISPVKLRKNVLHKR